MNAKESVEYREKRRLWAIQYRKENSEKLSQKHKFRLENDPEYAKRYKEKQDRRKIKYSEDRKQQTEKRKARSKELAEARKERERIRVAKSRQNLTEEARLARNASAMLWRNRNKERVNQQRRDERKRDPEKFKAQDRSRYERNPASGKLRRYGITEDQYNGLFERQNGCCAICGTHESSAGVKKLAIDHCHTKGHVRGLLCARCNTGLGQFRDSKDLLLKAIEYLT